MQPYIDEIFTRLRGDIFRKFVESDKYTRFCQWKNLELNIQVNSFFNWVLIFNKNVVFWIVILLCGCQYLILFIFYLLLRS